MGLVVAFTQRQTMAFVRMLRTCSFSLSMLMLSVVLAQAQFIENFDGPSVQLDPEGIKGWLFRAGDGTATMDLRQGGGGDGYASIFVDATTDKRGIWWALIERKVSDHMDLNLMQKPGHEFRIEARIRVSHAPRRVNLQVATQRSTDYDANLMEYDIADTTNWHVIWICFSYSPLLCTT